MSLYHDSISCPNCHVSDQTTAASRFISRDEDGDANYIRCDLCRHLSLSPDSTDRYHERNQYAGDAVPIEEVPARARALMTEARWTDEEIDEQVHSWVDPEWLEWVESDEYKALAASVA
jgi:hypothetical protein